MIGLSSLISLLQPQSSTLTTNYTRSSQVVAFGVIVVVLQVPPGESFLWLATVDTARRLASRTTKDDDGGDDDDDDVTNIEEEQFGLDGLLASSFGLTQSSISLTGLLFSSQTL